VYKLPSTGGNGVIVIVDAFDYPTAENDLKSKLGYRITVDWKKVSNGFPGVIASVLGFCWKASFTDWPFKKNLRNVCGTSNLELVELRKKPEGHDHLSISFHREVALFGSPMCGCKANNTSFVCVKASLILNQPSYGRREQMVMHRGSIGSTLFWHQAETISIFFAPRKDWFDQTSSLRSQMP